jgi:hypothetical protein
MPHRPFSVKISPSRWSDKDFSTFAKCYSFCLFLFRLFSLRIQAGRVSTPPFKCTRNDLLRR